MRIAFIVTSFPTLSGTFIIRQVTGLMDRGHEVDIYGDRPGDLRTIHEDVDRYDLLARTHCPPMPDNLLLRILKGLWLLLIHGWKAPSVFARSLNVFRYGELAASFVLLYGAIPLLLPDRKEYDVIHCHFGPNGLKGIFFREAGLLRGKIITTFHGYDVNAYPRRRGAGVYRRLFERGDIFTANSRFTMHKCLALGCPKDRLVHLPVGVDLTKFSIPERRCSAGGNIRILTVGRLVEVKGISDSIRAVARLITRHPHVEYYVAGDGPLRDDLQRLSRALGVDAHVRFLGGRTAEQIRGLYADAHIFLLSGVTAADGAVEAQGLVLLEAQAAGLPVVATRVGGIPESVLDGESGFLVPEHDVDALADKLCCLIENPERRVEMGQAGRRYVQEHFDAEKLTDKLVRIYERLLEESPG